MNITIKVISNCRSCGSKRLVNIISLGSLYLSEFHVGTKKPQKSPLTLVLCENCLLLQLKHTPPTSLLYTDNYGYKSGVNQTMKDHLADVTRKSLIELNIKNKHINALDIGANDGTLLRSYPKNVFKIAVEPIKKFAKECEKYSDVVINDFFSIESYSKKARNIKADIITVISCFYDIDDPNKFLRDITEILNKNGILVIQQNYLKSMLDQNGFDNIVHEHLEYYSLISLTNLLKKHNLEIFDVELNSINGGSFRTYIAFKNKMKIANSVKKLMSVEKKLKFNKKIIYKNFAKKIEGNKKKINKFIKKQVSLGKVIYVYGASTRGNTLLQYFGLNNKLIKKAVERNPEKWGKRIASVGIKIISEEQARKDKPDYMLVLPWFFKDEFLKREDNYLKSGGHFIFPLPKLEII